MRKLNRCMAHRGWSSRAAENTVKAIKMAADEKKIYSIEMDVQLSKDGVPVIIHDFSVDRTTNGNGYVRDLTLAQLKQLDAGSWFSPEDKGEQIPTLEEVLEIVKGKTKLNLEIKTAGGLYEGIERKVIELVQKYSMEKDVVLTSFDHCVIKKANKMSANIETGLIIYGNPPLIKEQLASIGARTLSMAFPYLTKELINRDLVDVPIITWTANSKEEVNFIKSISTEIEICTNYPELVIE